LSDGSSGDDETLFANLRALAESSFPKHCHNCGRSYATAAEFATATAAIGPDSSGLKLGHDDAGREIVELFRNCVCGSTLMDAFDSRRDTSPAGLKRRQRFDELQRLMRQRGVAAAAARSELLKLMHGQKGDLVGLIRSSPHVPPQS
jgi:hypothetical protein